MATIVVHDWSEFITAVGTSGADVEFPHSSEYIVKTHDTNVDPNKLYVDTNGIVQTNVQPSDLPNLYENTFVLDANHDNDLRSGFTQYIAFYCNSVNGFGGYIKNASSTVVELFAFDHACNLSNIAFLNFSALNKHVFTTAGKLTFSYCLFTGKVEGTNSSYPLGVFNRVSNVIDFEFISCSFNIVLEGVRASVFVGTSSTGGAFLKFCRCEFDTKNLSTGNLYVIPEKCYFTGDYSGFNSIGLFSSGSIVPYASIFEISSTVDIVVYGNCANILINNELYTGTIPTGFLGVSSSDLANAQILRDTYNFPIQT